jgi:hypothetical protein
MTVLVLASLLLGSAAGHPSPLQDCGFHVLGRAAGEFEIRRESLPDGSVRAYVQSETVLSLLLPWSVGQSGEIVQATQEPVALAVRCEAGSITVTVQKKGAAPRALPVIDSGAQSRYRMRISVTPGTGHAVVFIIAPDGVITRDTIAPPADMFRGMVPLGPADVSITTETREAATAALTGTATLRWGGPYLLTTLEVEGGGRGDVIVDLGASRTLLTRSLLPSGVHPAPLVAVEHGPDGERTRSASMGALGGDVPDVGVVRLPRLTIGSLSVPDARVNVVDSLPPLGGVQVAGILGMDLIGAGAITRMTAGPTGGMLSLVTEPLAGAELEVPFSRVGGLVALPARVGDRSVPLILDTGARSTLLSESAARSLALEPVQTGEVFRGLDGTPLETWAAIIPALRLGSGQLDELRVNVAPLPVLEAMGIPEGGLLGQNLWERFSAVEIDWASETVRFYAKRPEH